MNDTQFGVLDRNKMIRAMLVEAKKISDELHNDVTALIHCADIRELTQLVGDEAVSDKEIILRLTDLGLEHHLYAK